jgi:hypothetical protein
MLKAVVELSDQFVKQVPGGGAVAVTVFSPATVMLARWFAVRGGSERPDPACGGEPVVLDMSVRDGQGASGGPVEWADESRPVETGAAIGRRLKRRPWSRRQRHR